MTSISVIMATARDSYPIIGMPNVHMLQPTIESLKNQSFKDFEFILVDGLYNLRSDLFKGDPFLQDRLPFLIKHISVEHNTKFNHAFWLENKRWAVCGTLNSAIIHAKGELLVRIDDCSMFDSDYLKKFWEGYQSGYFPMAMHIKYLGDKPAVLNREYLDIRKETDSYRKSLSRDERDKLLKKLYGENGLIRDTRYEIVKKEGGRKIAPCEWYYGYSSVSLEAALRVNGYCELFDGDKSLEDADMGSRLEMAGYKDKFLLDVNHQVIEHEHGPISTKIVDPGFRPIKCNYSVYMVNRKKDRWRANSSILSDKDIEFIRSESLRPPCTPPGSSLYDENCRGRWFDIWRKNQPIFDLREERKLYE